MEFKTDFLILGSGIAGLSLAIKVSTLGSVAIVTKKENPNQILIMLKAESLLLPIKQIVLMNIFRTP